MKKYLLILFSIVILANTCEKRISSEDKLKQFLKKKQNHIIEYIKLDKNLIKFDDGDTFFYKDIPIRILGIDTPEIIHKEHGIYKNQELGYEAAEFTKNELLKATIIECIPYRRDIYGRLLAHILIDGKLLAVKLIKSGFAYETVSYYGSNGFKEFEQKILEASQKSPKPKFEYPLFWRRKHQKK